MSFPQMDQNTVRQIRHKNVSAIYQLIGAVEKAKGLAVVDEEKRKEFYSAAQKWEEARFRKYNSSINEDYQNTVKEKIRLLQDLWKKHSSQPANPPQPATSSTNFSHGSVYQAPSSVHQQPIQPSPSNPALYSRSGQDPNHQYRNQVPVQVQVQSHGHSDSHHQHQHLNQSQNPGFTQTQASSQYGQTPTPQIHPENNYSRINPSQNYHQPHQPQQQQQQQQQRMSPYADDITYETKYFKLLPVLRGSTLDRIHRAKAVLAQMVRSEMTLPNGSIIPEKLESARKIQHLVARLRKYESVLQSDAPPAGGFHEGIKNLEKIYTDVKTIEAKLRAKSGANQVPPPRNFNPTHPNQNPIQQQPQLNPQIHHQQHTAPIAPAVVQTSIPRNRPTIDLAGMANEAGRRSPSSPSKKHSSQLGRSTPAQARQIIKDNNILGKRNLSSTQLFKEDSESKRHKPLVPPTASTPQLTPPAVLSPSNLQGKRFGGKQLSVLRAKTEGSTPPTSPQDKIDVDEHVAAQDATDPKSTAAKKDPLDFSDCNKPSKLALFLDEHSKQPADERKQLHWEKASKIAAQVLVDFDNLF